jgi:hypothetical protein
MPKLTIADSRDHFLCDGNKSFLLGDSIFTAFYNITFEEWKYYLEFRKSQGFNLLSINVLHQWDGGEPALGIYPFSVDKTGRFQFHKLNREYFSHAGRIVSMAVERGFIPKLTILHASYVPGTWATKRRPETIMPREAVTPYVEYIIDTFAQYDPVYMISGDTDLEYTEATDYFWQALEIVKAGDPDALVGLGLAHNYDLPQQFAESENVGFYCYQAGHRIEEIRDGCVYKLAKRFHEKLVKRPIINGEFTYEGHGYGHENYGRYNDFDIRRGIWQGILSGAKAGAIYGAHGLWGWYVRGRKFLNEEFAGKAFSWQVALKFPGASDAAFARWIFEEYDLFDLKPSEKILNKAEQQRNEISMSVSRDSSKVVIYSPFSVDIEVGMDLSGYGITAVDLKERRFFTPEVKLSGESSIIEMGDINSDVLYLGCRKRE